MIFPTIFVFTLICFQVVCHMHVFTYTSASDKHLYQMILMSCKKVQRTTIVTSKAGTIVILSEPLISFHVVSGILATKSLVRCVEFCLSFCTLFWLLYCSVLFRITCSDYSFVIFTFFYGYADLIFYLL